MNNDFTKYDIMISYSTRRKEVAMDIFDTLIEFGYNVWMAPISIPSGSDYRDEIYSAIDNSNMILFVLCEESLNSTWCQNELIYSIKQNKKLLPVQISYVLNPYDKLGEINYSLGRKQILNLFPEYKIKLEEIISKVEYLLKEDEVSTNPYPKMNNISIEDEIIGRDKEVLDIYEMLKTNNVLNIYGMGGIGKTSIVRKYFSTYAIKGAYQSVHIAKYSSSLKSTIANIPFTGFDQEAFLSSIKDTSILKEDALFEKKMAMLNNHSNEILLVIDGMDYASQSEMDLLSTLSSQVVVTSRNKYSNVNSYEVKPLSDEYLIELYSIYSKMELDEENIKVLKDIINEVGKHTLTIKLIACYAYDIYLTPKEIKEEGILSNLKEFDNDEEKISTLLDKCKFSNEEIYALQVLALFPNGISKGKFQKIDRKTLRVYPSLVKKGWVLTDDVSYQLHQIIRELVLDKYPVTTLNIKEFLTVFLDVFRKIGFESNELLLIMKHMTNVVTGNDYLMCKMLHLFGNAFCDIGYSQFFYVSSATYANQDMNFYNKKNEHKAHFEEFLYSLELNKRALEIANTLDNEEKEILPYIYSYLGSTNFNMNKYEEALRYQLKALSVAKELLEETHSNYLTILNRIGLTALEVNDYKEALKAFKEYERIGLEHNLDLNYAMVKFNLGNVCYYTKDYDNAIKYYLESIELNKDDLDTSFGYSELCMSMAFIYKEKNDMNKARFYYNIAKEVKKRIIIDVDVLNNFVEKYDLYFNI